MMNPPSSQRMMLRSCRVASSSSQMPMAQSTGTSAQLQPPAITASAAAAALSSHPMRVRKKPGRPIHSALSA